MLPRLRTSVSALARLSRHAVAGPVQLSAGLATVFREVPADLSVGLIHPQLHPQIQTTAHRLHATTSSLQRWPAVKWVQQRQQHWIDQRHVQQPLAMFRPTDLRYNNSNSNLYQRSHQQLRRYSVDEAARKRLLAAQQRRQRQQELEEARNPSAAAGGDQGQLVQPAPPAAAAAVDTQTTAIAPQESIPTPVQVGTYTPGKHAIISRLLFNMCYLV